MDIERSVMQGSCCSPVTVVVTAPSPGSAVPGVQQRGLVGDPKSEPVTQPHWCWLQFRATITY